MSSLQLEASPIISSRDELAQWLEAGNKPAADWRIGTEHEKFSFNSRTLMPIQYEGEIGVRRLLEEMASRFDWIPVMEGANIIGLEAESGEIGGNISLEPGGQFELSGAPLSSIHKTCEEVHRHLKQAQEIGGDLGIGFLGLGFSPKWSLAETPRMPKGRYDVMSSYMPKVGSLGLDMMYRTTTVQVNLDFSNEADMVKKLRVSLALQPIATALFANSPFKEGKPNGFLSYRSQIWKDTDSDRTGMLPFVFEEGMGFERYVDYALDVPMYFVYRDGRYIDVAGLSFKDFMAGKLEALPGERPSLDDWSNHLTTIFPEVRLKRFLEMRGADGGSWRNLCALPAFWVGLLYDQSALDSAYELIREWSADERQKLRDDVPHLALKASIRGRSVLEISRDLIDLSRQGLKNRNRLDTLCNDESLFLSPLENIVASGRTQAEELLDRYENEWQGDIDHLFRDYAF